MKNPRCGWYSLKQAEAYGHNVYTMVNDWSEVQVTDVTDPDQGPTGNWDDYVYVGLLGLHIRTVGNRTLGSNL
jgi:hypothetical protein